MIRLHKGLSFIFAFIFLGFPGLLLPDLAKADTSSKPNQKIDDIVQACVQEKKRDRICDALISYKQIGDDAVEAAKEFLDLSPTTYAMLTTLNMIAVGRLRIRTRSFLVSDARHVYDIRKDSVMAWFEKDF